MLMTNQLITDLQKIIEKITKDGYDDNTLKNISSSISPFLEDEVALEKIEEKDLIKYLFRGWILTKLLEDNVPCDRVE